MADTHDQGRIAENLAVIRRYLKQHFPRYTFTEMSVQNLYHMFVVADHKLKQRHVLKVDWARLSDPSNTPENTRIALEMGDVARGMMQTGDSDYYW